jgi:hypothetical protein
MEAIVLVLSIAVLVVAPSIVLFASLENDVSASNQSRQYQDDPTKHPFQLSVLFVIKSIGCRSCSSAWVLSSLVAFHSFRSRQV